MPLEHTERVAFTPFLCFFTATLMIACPLSFGAALKFIPSFSLNHLVSPPLTATTISLQCSLLILDEYKPGICILFAPLPWNETANFLFAAAFSSLFYITDFISSHIERPLRAVLLFFLPTTLRLELQPEDPLALFLALMPPFSSFYRIMTRWEFDFFLLLCGQGETIKIHIRSAGISFSTKLSSSSIDISTFLQLRHFFKSLEYRPRYFTARPFPRQIFYLRKYFSRLLIVVLPIPSSSWITVMLLTL